MGHHTALTALATLVLSTGCASRAAPETTTADASRSRIAAEASNEPRRGTEGAEAACDLQTVHYAFDSSELDQAARNKLEANARRLRRQHLATAAVIGMTDSRGTEEYNLALGDRRARTASDYMKALGVEGERLRPRSVGEELANGDEEEGWAVDRRAEILAE
jgi:peptidoglycan-associated lipoprotein